MSIYLKKISNFFNQENEINKRLRNFLWVKKGNGDLVYLERINFYFEYFEKLMNF